MHIQYAISRLQQMLNVRRTCGWSESRMFEAFSDSLNHLDANVESARTSRVLDSTTTKFIDRQGLGHRAQGTCRGRCRATPSGSKIKQITKCMGQILKMNNVFGMVRCASTLLQIDARKSFAEAVEVPTVLLVRRKNRNSQNVWRAQNAADYNEGKKKQTRRRWPVVMGHAVVKIQSRK